MALPPGSRLGAYEIVAPLGAGGMGEVYRARDTKLGRDVALKLLPDAFASDPDRLARFQREAHVLASLNHPNIAAIHGLEDADGAHALVMELVEGEDLSQRPRTSSEARVQVENLLSGAPEDMATAATVSAAQPMASRQRRVVAALAALTAHARTARAQDAPQRANPLGKGDG